MVPRPMVQAVVRDRMGSNPAVVHAGLQERLACRSQRAQSSALRAPPRGNQACTSIGVVVERSFVRIELS